MSATEDERFAHQQRLLSALHKELIEREVSAVLVTAVDGRPALDVMDSGFRPRRVFVQLPFRWLYWGDRSDERVSFHDLSFAADRITQASRKGWHEGEQGDLQLRIDEIANVYRPR